MRLTAGQRGTPIIGIAGWKKSGKTTLTERLVEVFARRGLRVATVKHAHHGFQIDDAHTDSARHRRAGARQVAIVSAKRWALITELNDTDEPSFEDVIAMLGPCDLVIVEGYKSAPFPKIEVRRSAAVDRTPIAPDDPTVIAIAADHSVTATEVPVFALDDAAGLAAMIEAAVGPLARQAGKKQR